MRSIDTNIRDSLLKEEPFVYAHVVKFEKPLRTDGGKSARRAKDYVYITDGSFDIEFDDESLDVNGGANGPQTYIANKLFKVGTVAETTEARASSMNLQLSAAALGATFTDNINISTTQITSSKSFVEEGFREGDSILLLSGSGSNDTVKARIDTFSNSNKTANITPLTKEVSGERVEVSSLSSENGVLYSVNFDSPEIEGILSNRSEVSYARYINRDVFVYKVHINPETGLVTGMNQSTKKGGAYLLFKGIIGGGKLSEDPGKASTMSWNITSHWGDFQRVSGRLTSDPHHRALNGSGIPDTEAVTRPAYATDLGFLHSETAVNLMAIYQVQETRYKLKKKSSWFGLRKSYSQEEYQVQVDREADLRFNLDAKYLPVVYGVNKIDSIPVFVDTLNTDSKQIFVAYALCEGEIGGVYDIYFDDTNSVCLDANDSSTRSNQTSENTIDVLCQGRMDRGDTLTANTVVGAATKFHGHGFGGVDWSRTNAEVYAHQAFIPTVNTSFSAGALGGAAGITHEKGTGFVTPIDTRIQVHTGKPDQKASPILVRNANNFKVGTDYYSGNEKYWGASHRLLDTAYVVANYTIGEGETTIPSLDFVVRGKGIKCYDYDFSYAQDPAYSGSDASSSTFKLGETVTVKLTGTNTTIATLVIADIYSHTLVDGSTQTRFRFKDASSLSPAFTAFYITNSSNGLFHFVTYNHTTVSGTVAKQLKETITSQSTNSGGSSIDITMSSADSVFQKALALGGEASVADLSGAASGPLYNPEVLNTYLFGYTGSGTTITDVGNTTQNASTVVGKSVVVKDAVALAAGASSSDNAYNGYVIEVTRKYPDNTIKVQTRTIVDYDGGERVASVDSAFDEDAIPTTNDTYKILSPVAGDIRVSTNPAMQLLDYLQAKRYGRDLQEEDLDLPSFFEAARDCDTRSEVTVLTTAQATVGDIYEYNHSNKRHFVGTVKSSTAISLSGLGTRYNTTFEDVAGQLLHRWTNIISFFTGELYFHNGYLNRATTNGAVTSAPTSSGVTSLSLARLQGSGASSLVLDVNSTNRAYDGNPVIKNTKSIDSFGSGYNLYDCGDVKYWRYLGWEAKNQRHVTRHQTNAVINTASSLFENVNSMLGHFNGILRYSNGKYSLGVKKAAAVPETVTVSGVTYTIGDISDEDIIGGIKVEDAGQRGTYNSVSVQVPDPQNLFESRSVTMFDSTYLKQDRMVPKKGDVKAPYVTNYFNARINAKQYLDDSRAGLKINFTIAPSGLLLRAGDIIRVTYTRFGWTNKLYRIMNINFQENCLIQITAEEHNDSGYIVQPDFPLAAIPAETTAANVAIPAAPVLDDPATNKRGGVVLNWTNSSKFNPSTYTVQIYRTAADPHGNDRTNSVLVGTSKGTQFTDPIVEAGANTFYYWIRYAVNVPQQRTSGVAPREIFSAYHPVSSTAGKSSTAAGTIDGMMISDVNDNASVLADAGGTPVSFANTFTTLKVFIGGDPIKYDNASPYANNTFRVSNVTATNVTQGAVTAPSNGTNVAYNSANITAMSADTGSLEYTIIVKNSIGEETTHEKLQTFTKVKNGAFGKTVELIASKYVINYATSGTETDSLTFTATARNFTGITPYFEFFVNGQSKQASATGSGTPPTKTFTLADSDEPAIGGTKTILVQVRDGSASGSIVAEDSVSVFGVQDGSDAITGFLTNEAHTVGSDFIGNSSLGSAGGTFKVFVGGTDVTTSCSFSVSSENDVDVSINSSTGVYTVNSFPTGNQSGNASLLASIPANLAPSGNTTVLGKVYTISKARAAAAVFTTKLTNEAHSFTGDVNGNVSSTNLAAGGGTFQVFKDGTNVTSNSGVTFTKVSESNITASINSSTGVYSISAFTASAAQGSAVFRATISSGFSGTGSALTFDIEYTCSKANKGVDGVSGSGVAELTIYYQYSPYGSGGTSSFPSTPSTGTFNFSTGVVASLPTGWSQNEPGTGQATITVQSSALATESSSGSGVSGTLSWSSPSFARGAPGSTNFIFIYSASQPSTPGATDAATNDGIPSGWSDSIPTNPNNGNKLWSSKGKASLSGNILSGVGLKVQYNWETPVVHVQAKGDVGLGNVDNESSSTIRGGTLTGNLTGNIGGVGYGIYEDGVARARLGFNTSGDVQRTVSTTYGGTGQGTSTANFLNSGVSFASLATGQITINRGGFSQATLSGINNSFVGLANVDNQSAATIRAGNFTGTFGGVSNANMRDGVARAQAGFNSSGDVQRSVSTTYGGTGQGTSTANFLNSGVSFAALANGQITLNRGAFSTATLSGIGGSFVGLGNVDNNSTATIRAGTTKANVGLSNVDNESSATIRGGNITGTFGGVSNANMRDGVARAQAGFDSSGNVQRSVSTTYGGTGQGTSTANFLNSGVSFAALSNGQITLNRGAFSTATLSGIGSGFVGLGNVSNITTATIRSGTSKSDVGLSNVDNNSTATIRAGVTKANVGLGNVANETRATILGGNLTGTVNGTAASTVVSRANAGATVLAASRSFVGYSVYEGTGSGSTKSTLPSGNTSITITASGAGSGTATLVIGPNSANTAINQVSFSGSGFAASGATSVGFGSSGGVVVTHTSSGQKISIGYSFINAREATVAICCFTGETLVNMRDGSRKPIRDIKLGDLVLVETGTAEVIELHPTVLGDRKLYSLNGGKAFVTAEHPFRTEEGWKSIDPEKTKLEREGLYEELTGALQVGDTVLKTDGVYHEITEITAIDGDPHTPLYNFSVNLEDHSYFADGYCVHNK